jgi:hypothetical protein
MLASMPGEPFSVFNKVHSLIAKALIRGNAFSGSAARGSGRGAKLAGSSGRPGRPMMSEMK